MMSRDEKLAPASNADYKLLQTNRNNLDASFSSNLTKSQYKALDLFTNLDFTYGALTLCPWPAC